VKPSIDNDREVVVDFKTFHKYAPGDEKIFVLWFTAGVEIGIVKGLEKVGQIRYFLRTSNSKIEVDGEPYSLCDFLEGGIVRTLMDYLHKEFE